MFKYANPLPYNHGLLVCGISVNKDVLYEFHWLFRNPQHKFTRSKKCQLLKGFRVAMRLKPINESTRAPLWHKYYLKLLYQIGHSTSGILSGLHFCCSIDCPGDLQRSHHLLDGCDPDRFLRQPLLQLQRLPDPGHPLCQPCLH